MGEGGGLTGTLKLSNQLPSPDARRAIRDAAEDRIALATLYQTDRASRSAARRRSPAGTAP
ncbi:hypothetical protein MBUL_01080 [Methylobacterium bullatum]|uniref:Uncharacterized protein n=1 Tax=Methylobacterium bullatum TaxID=570505 RepID=A0A679IY28_9HYPH|nr:hypothetical protein MBUL_01080 [Methylobacterium bullatum]